MSQFGFQRGKLITTLLFNHEVAIATHAQLAAWLQLLESGRDIGAVFF